LGETTSFNRIEIAVPSIDTRIDTLRFDGQAWTEIAASGNADDPLLSSKPERLAPAAGSADSLGQFAQTVTVDPTTNSPKLLIKLPRMSSEHFQFGQNIEVVFKSKLFRGSKEFTSVVWNDAVGDPEATISQPAANGDATPDVATNALLVVVDDIVNVVNPPVITPNPFTPNGDGINDVVTFSFDLFLLLKQAKVELDIYDLSGRRIAQLQKGSSTAGKLEVQWDGRDDEGAMVPPGLYLYRLIVDSDETAAERSGTLSLVY
jgi:gliding motility-associated-like protein